MSQDPAPEQCCREDAQLIANLSSDRWTPEVEALFPLMLPEGSKAKGSDFNSILLLAHHPRLAEPWLRFNAEVARPGTVPPRLKEVAILRTAWRRGSAYEWVHHALAGGRAGLSAHEISALQDEKFTALEVEALVVQATDEICLGGGVSATTLALLREEWTTEQIMELIFVVGCYVALAAILNTANAAIEPQFVQAARSAGLPLLRTTEGSRA